MSGAGRWVKVAEVDQLPVGAPRVVPVEGRRVAVIRTEDGVFAIEDTCTHDDGPLAEGAVRGNEIECPRHGARFDVRSGAALSMPAVVPVRSFPARVRGGSVEIEVGE